MVARIMIAGTGSGCGKTSVVCGLLGAFLAKGKKVVSFKSGPDYIDPLFHQKVLGIPSYNLDSFLSGEEGVKRLLKAESQAKDIAVVEGVMGFYDGVSGEGFEASSRELSQITQTPVLLVVNCKGKGASVAAEINGYVDFAPNNIAGVILNNVSQGMESYYREIIEKYCSVKIMGFLPHLPKATLEERKLGLFLGNQADYKNRLKLLADAALKSIDLDGILELAEKAPEIEAKTKGLQPLGKATIGIAKDEVFAFQYAYDLEILQQLGAKLEFFSPLWDKQLPPNISGLIIGGGYLAESAEKLSQNKNLLNQIKKSVGSGLPTIAMGGGAALLAQSLDDHKLAGVIDTRIKTSDRMSNFGYHQLTAKSDNLLCKKGESFPVHEFHYFTASDSGDGFSAQKPNGSNHRACCFVSKTLYAGFPYISFCGNENLAENFVAACVVHQKAKIHGA